MPPRMRRSSFAGRGGAQRRKLVWSTFDAVSSSLASGASGNYDLLADIGNATLGCTIMRTHLRVAPTTASPAFGDSIQLGFIVGRVVDAVDPVTAGLINVAQTDLDWMFINRYTAAPFLDEAGSNTVVIDLKAKRKMQELQQAYIFTLKNNFTAVQAFRVYARTLIALP
jgi:hypothetical protein